MGCPQEIEIAPWKRLVILERQIIAAVPPVQPQACHWLDSDSAPSYCRKHAWEARWGEMPTVGPCPEEPDRFRRSDFDEFLASGIDGRMQGMPGESDGPLRCDTCGCTLEYVLTDYGVAEELSHFEAYPVRLGDKVDGEHTYALTRIFMNLDRSGADPDKLAAALRLAEDTLTAVQSNAQ